MEDFELKFAEKIPEDKDNYSIIYGDKKYNGWFRYTIDSKEYKDIIVRFRLPKTIPLYSDVARQFTSEERIVGIHRMLVGKDLQEETKELLKYNTLNEFVANLEDDEVNKLLNRMKNIVTFNCNKIPYLHIRMRKSFLVTEKNYEETIKKHIKSHPDYLKIFYDVLNESISIEEAKILSKGIIYSEYLELGKK